MHNGSSLLFLFIFFFLPVALCLTCVTTLASSLDNPADPVLKICGRPRKDTPLIWLLCCHKLIYCSNITWSDFPSDEDIQKSAVINGTLGSNKYVTDLDYFPLHWQTPQTFKGNKLKLKGIVWHFGKFAFLLRVSREDWYHSHVCTVNVKLL